MDIDRHILISELSEKYADHMCDGDCNRQFCRGSIAAAYIVGANETLRRLCNIIKASAQVKNGLTPQQSRTLLDLIEDIENTSVYHYDNSAIVQSGQTDAGTEHL